MPDFKLPDLGEGVHEGQIIRLHAKVGDFVKEDDPFMEVETDKAAVEIRAPFTGVIEKWHVKEGQVAHVGDVMVTWKKESGGRRQEAGGGRQRSEVGGQTTSAAMVEPRVPSPRPSPAPGHGGSGGPNGAPSPVRVHKPASPATRKFAREKGLDIESIAGSGPNGRVTREDVERVAAGATGFQPVCEQSVAAATDAPSIQPSPRPSPQGRGGHDAPSRESSRMGRGSESAIPPGEDSSDAHGPVRRVALTQARKTIAANMTLAWTTIPNVTDSDDADVTELEVLRKGYPSPANKHRKLTMLVFIVRAVAQALVRHPVFNASFDAEKQEIIYKRYINIAVGVHTDRGLVAPVIRDADRLSVIQIADALDAIIAKARIGSFAVSDTRGGTYTISNAGAFGGSRYSTPIVTPGQCAVLAAGKARWMPWVVGDEKITGGTPVPPFPVSDMRVPSTPVQALPRQIAPRLILPLSHSFDHRVADGGQEVAFLQDVIGQLENPARLMF
jgi:pyruvate dehydrogenase E2 component (dihydrolipoamide acetyltransferase)